MPANVVSGPMQVHRLDVPLSGAQYPLQVSGTPTPLFLGSANPFFNVAVGNSITLSGLGFDPTPVNNNVRFKSATGTVGATVISASTSSLTVPVPSNAVCGPLTVNVGSQTSNARTVTVLGTPCGVQLTDTWESGSWAGFLMIEGAGFDPSNLSNNVVRFAAAGGGTVTAPIISVGLTFMMVHIPPGAVPGDVTVSVGAATSNAIPWP